MKSSLNGFLASLVSPRFAPTALRVAILVGTLLFAINHGNALVRGTMSRDRWISAALTYCVPYIVNIHGQFISMSRSQNS